MEEPRILTREWDKTFPKSEKVNHRKITFHNRYGIYPCGGPVRAQGRCGQVGRHRRMRPLWRGQGAGRRPLCPDPGGARLPHPSL